MAMTKNASLAGARDPIPGLTRQQFEAWFAKSRGRQGLPLHVHDPVILAKVAAIVRDAIRETETDDLDAAA
jgi:hypothetical protein